MNEPRRWLDGSDPLSADELRVLQAGLEAEVPKGVKAAVKSALLSQLSAPGPGPSPQNVAAPRAAAAAPGVSTGTTATLGALKAVGLGLALGMAGAASWVTLRPGGAVDHAEIRSGSPVAAASASAPGGQEPVGTSSVAAPTPSSEARALVQQREVVTAPVREAKAQDADTGSAPPADQAPSVATFPEPLSAPLAASSESSRLAQARVLLRNNDASAAFAALESLKRDHPRGLLVQEREVLTIEALLALGQEEAARTRAQDFLRRHPKSPHAASALRVLERR